MRYSRAAIAMSIAIRIGVAIFSISLTMAGPAYSLDVSITTESLYRVIYDRCGEKWGSPGGIAECLEEEERAVGKDLTIAYENALRSLNPEHQNKLRISQRAWLSYQNNYCNIMRTLPSLQREGSSFGSLSYASCLLKTTLSRLSELELLLQ